MEITNFLKKTVAALTRKNPLEVGMYAFEHNKFSHDPQAYPNLIGVVAWLSPLGGQSLILETEEKILPWEEARRYYKECPLNHVSEMHTILPTKRQWRHILKNQDKIRKSLQRIQAKPLAGWYWSFAKYDYVNLWAIDSGSGILLSLDRDSKGGARRILAF